MKNQQSKTFYYGEKAQTYYKTEEAICAKCNRELDTVCIWKIHWFRNKDKAPISEYFHPESCIREAKDWRADAVEQRILCIVPQGKLPKDAVLKFPRPPELVTTKNSFEAVFNEKGEHTKIIPPRSRPNSCIEYLEEKGFIPKEERKELSYEAQQELLKERTLELEQRPHETIMVKASGWETPETLKAQAEKQFDNEILKAERGAFFDQVMAERILNAKPDTKNLLENKKPSPGSGVVP